MATAVKGNAGRGGFAGILMRDSQYEARNPALEKIDEIVAESSHVKVDTNKLSELAVKYSKEQLLLPKWDAPVFMKGASEEVVDFMMLGNSINFAFTDFATGNKYEFPYANINWAGAFGMWSSIKSAHEEGKPVLDGGYLAELTLEGAKKIFNRTSQIPMLQERVKILNEVGKTLVEKYDSHFHNVLEASKGRIFDGGRGFVEILTRDFPSFDDRAEYRGRQVVFNKRAQLAAIMLHEKFLAEGKDLFRKRDVDTLSVAADYELPRVLHILKVINYDADLERKIKEGELIPAKSEEEVEIRANTIFAAKQLQDRINHLRGGVDEVNALHIDYRLWNEGRQYKDAERHHLTVTTAY
jgi:hypothetical protein